MDVRDFFGPWLPSNQQLKIQQIGNKTEFEGVVKSYEQDDIFIEARTASGDLFFSMSFRGEGENDKTNCELDLLIASDAKMNLRLETDYLHGTYHKSKEGNVISLSGQVLLDNTTKTKGATVTVRNQFIPQVSNELKVMFSTEETYTFSFTPLVKDR